MIHYSLGEIKEYSHQTELTVSTDKLRIENYQEEPFHEWNSQEPVGVRVQFDLVGAGQKDQFLGSLMYGVSGYGGMNLYSQCIPDDSAMEEQKKNFKKGFYQSYLLIQPDRNRLIYKCYSPLFSKFFTDFGYICPHKNAKGLLNNPPTNIDGELSVMVSGAEEGAKHKRLDGILKRDIPENSLLYSAEFWLRAELQYNKVTLPEGRVLCMFTPFDGTLEECVCRKDLVK